MNHYFNNNEVSDKPNKDFEESVMEYLGLNYKFENWNKFLTSKKVDRKLKLQFGLVIGNPILERNAKKNIDFNEYKVFLKRFIMLIIMFKDANLVNDSQLVMALKTHFVGSKEVRKLTDFAPTSNCSDPRYSSYDLIISAIEHSKVEFRKLVMNSVIQNEKLDGDGSTPTFNPAARKKIMMKFDSRVYDFDQEIEGIVNNPKFGESLRSSRNLLRKDNKGKNPLEVSTTFDGSLDVPEKLVLLQKL